MASAPSTALLRKLKIAAKAARPFVLACKRALEVIPININESQSSQSQSQSFSQPEEQPLTEGELRAWREATEPMFKHLPENNTFFVPYNLLASNEDPLLRAQINVINLALTLEMFLPATIREKYPLLTMKIPFVDGSSTLSQQSSQSSQFSQLTEEQRLQMLTLPLAELKTIFLRMCAGRTYSHVTYVLKNVITEICCVSIITSTKARGLRSFRPQDLIDTFGVGFLRDPSLIGPGDRGCVFDTEKEQEKACSAWKKWAGDKIKKLQHDFTNPLLTGKNTSVWDALADVLLTDVFRHLLRHVLETLSVEEKKQGASSTARGEFARVGVATSAVKTPSHSGAIPGGALDSVDARFFVAKKRTPIEVPKLPSAASSVSVMNPPAGAEAATSMVPPKTRANQQSVSQRTKATASMSKVTASSAVAATNPKTSDARADVDEDEFGPRILNPTNRGRTMRSDKTRAALEERHGIVTQEFDMMDFVQNFGGEDVEGPGNDAGIAYFGNEDFGGAEDPVEDAETQWEDRIAMFGQVPYVQPPIEGYTRIPKGFVFNAPQANAEKVTMTPSPEFQRPVYTRAPGPKPSETRATDADRNDPTKKSTLSRIKAAVGTDRARGKTVSRGASTEPSETVKSTKVARGQKRKQQIDEEAEEVPDDDQRKQPAKKRKVGNDDGQNLNIATVLPNRSGVGTSRASAAPSAAIVNAQNAMYTPTLLKAMDSSSVRGGIVPAVPAPPRRPPVMADTDSEDEPLPRGRRTIALPATSPSPPPVPAAKAKLKTKPTAVANSTAIKEKPKATRRIVPLTVSDAIMDGSRQRLSEIKAINEKHKQLDAALYAHNESEEDKDTTEEEDDSEEELRKYREREARQKGKAREQDDGDNDADELEKSYRKLANLKKRMQAIDKLPPPRRARHTTALSDEEGDKIEDFDKEEEPVDRPRKRGRPRKVTVSRSTSPVARKGGKKVTGNPYRTGANENGRRRWTEEEDRALLFGLKVARAKGDALHPWQAILNMHGPDGTNSTLLGERNVVQMKDRARNIALRMYNEGQAVPDHLAWIKLPKNKLRK